MTKTIVERRPTVDSPFRSENTEYNSNPKVISFLAMCVTKGIITNETTHVSDDGLLQTRTFETTSPKLIDSLREFYFPGNQQAQKEWEKLNQHTITENPSYDPDITELDLEKFIDFVSSLER